MLKDMSARAIIDQVYEMLRTRHAFATPRQKQPFEARLRGDVVEIRNARGNLRPVRDADFVHVIRRLQALEKPTVGDFQDITHHASYVLALIAAALKNEELQGALEGGVFADVA